MTAVGSEVHDQLWRVRKPAEQLPIEGMAEHVLQTVRLELAIQRERVLAQQTGLTGHPAGEPPVQKRSQLSRMAVDFHWGCCLTRRTEASPAHGELMNQPRVGRQIILPHGIQSLLGHGTQPSSV